MLAELIKIHTEDGLSHFGAIYQAPNEKIKKFGVVLVHGMTGHFIGEVESALPPALAQAGYTCLVANNRGCNFMGAATEKFAGCLPDIQASIDGLAEGGYDHIALLGHSKGGVKVAYYMAKRHDPRVIALGVLSPAENVHRIGFWEWFAKPGQSRQEFLQAAQELVEQGKGETIFTSSVWPYIVSAGTVVEHAKTRGDDVLKNIKGLTIPVLAMCGELETDWCGVVSALRKSPPEGYQVEVVPGADHVYAGRETELGKVVIGWLDKTVH